jgi:hypothetical protein
MITPAATIFGGHELAKLIRPTRIKFTDGGFVDNSGALTAAKVIRRAMNTRHDFSFVLLRIQVDVDDDVLASAGPDLLLSTETLYRVRSFHQKTIGLEVDRELRNLSANPLLYSKTDIVVASLPVKGDFLLSWQLAESSRKEIEASVERYLNGREAVQLMTSIGCSPAAK